MKTETKAQIIDFIKKRSKASPHDLVEHLEVSSQAVHRHLKALIESGRLKKLGTPPHVFYVPASKSVSAPKIDLLLEDQDFLNQYYLYISPKGQILRGLPGFLLWAKNSKQSRPLDLLVSEFISLKKNSLKFLDLDLNLIPALKKFETTFDSSHLDKAYYSDFYSLPKFGKTPLGSLVLHAKQAQDVVLIKKIANQCQLSLKKLIQKEKIQAIIWTPHSLPRKIPFLKELKKHLKLGLPEVVFLKAYEGEVPIAQKSLSKLEERIENAESTIFLRDQDIGFERILIVDDAVGSGSTLQAIAAKVKHVNKKAFVVGYAVVGSLKGFEVIREV